MEFPKIYTEDDVQELVAWYDGRELPESLVLSPSTAIPDLRKTVSLLLDVAKEHWANQNFAGYIIRLEEIRRKLEGQEVY